MLRLSCSWPWFRILILLLIPMTLAQRAEGQDSLFEQINTLRFGQIWDVAFESGTLDLRDLPKKSFYHAQGNVWFIPGEFLPPQYLDEDAFQSLMQQKKALSVPLRLRTRLWSIEGAATNYGTFVLRFKNRSMRRLAAAFPRLYHPMEIHYVDGQRQARIFAHLKPDPDPTLNISRNNLSAPNTALDAAGDFLFYIHVSSPLIAGRNAINLSSFYIGDESYVNRVVYSSRNYVMLLSGSFLIIFIFYLFIFIFRTTDTSSLYLSFYALLCLLVSSLYSFSYGLDNNSNLDLFSTLNIWSVAFLQLYLLQKLAFLMSRTLHRCLIGVALAIAGFASYGSMIQNDAMWSLFYILSALSSAVLILGTIYLGLKHRLSGIYFFLFGATGTYVFQAYVLSMALLNQNTEFGYGVLLGNSIMAIGLALVNAKEFAVTYRRSVEQGLALEEKNKEILFFNKSLEEMVHQKTSEIRSLLDHIPQGVMSIKAGGIIDKDYSEHLAAILETSNIAHEGFFELILKNCQMSSDQRDQVWQSIQACLGEDILNYDVNIDKFPSELSYRTASGHVKCLRATWNAEARERIVNRIMITLLDVTTERDFQRESEEQRKDLELIHELINLSPNKASQFFSTSLPLLQENQRILKGTQDIDISAIRLLFVNAHTVKGSARTLQLKQLAQQIHQMEDVYARILREGIPLDQPRLIQDVEASMAMLQRYLALNTHTLNRAESFDKVILDRDFIESHYYFVQDFLDEPLPRIDIVEWLRVQNEKLTKLIFEQLPAVFEGYRERAVKIARDLGKPEPIFDIDIDEVALPPDKKAALDNCMVHILRNALDHGIESAEERQKAGKNPQGRLRVRTLIQDGFLTITMDDDGRGLALASIRTKALRHGLIQPDSEPAAIADTIFSAHISTAQAVSEISGRGMGMNAVRTFLDKVGGRVRIELGSPKDHEGLYQEFAIVISLPLGPLTSAPAQPATDVA